jgi:DNA-binding transcriptional LysR family regulator
MFGQPALSMQISELENELEAKLVERQHGATVKVRRAAHHWQTEARFLA